MKKISLSVVIPSRKQAKQFAFLTRSIGSIRDQSVANLFDIKIIIGVDKGAMLSEEVLKELNASCVESEKQSQAAALNAAIQACTGDLIAFIEDDDQWEPYYLECAIQALQENDFVSTTQGEISETGEYLKTNDFPSPSGWIMRASTIKTVGPFNESYRYHLDNEWLGRLGLSGLKRVHLMESTAPIIDIPNVRPMLLNLVNQPGTILQIRRHFSPTPLVRRLVHKGSGMHHIRTDEKSREISLSEKQLLIKTYGRIPW